MRRAGRARRRSRRRKRSRSQRRDAVAAWARKPPQNVKGWTKLPGVVSRWIERKKREKESGRYGDEAHLVRRRALAARGAQIAVAAEWAMVAMKMDAGEFVWRTAKRARGMNRARDRPKSTIKEERPGREK